MRANKEVSIGYNTDLYGSIDFDKALTDEQAAEFQEFCNKDHRNESYSPSYGYWCQYELQPGNQSFAWDGGEKFYNYEEWIKILIEQLFKPWGITLNGVMQWSGEEADDNGYIYVTNNEVTSINTSEYIQHLEAGINKLLSLVPEQLPLLMGINSTLDTFVQKAMSAGMTEESLKIDQKKGAN